MTSQTVQYQGGSPTRLSDDDVLAIARRSTFGLPIGFFLGMAIRESGKATNEIDTDYDADGNPRSAKTYGLLQITQSEAAAALSLAAVDTDQLLDPDTNLYVGASTFDAYSAALAAAGFAAGAGGLPYVEDDVRKYVALAHNIGIGSATRSVATYGLDWSALVARPQKDLFRQRQIPYCESIEKYSMQYPDIGTSSSSILPKIAIAILLGYFVVEALA